MTDRPRSISKTRRIRLDFEVAVDDRELQHRNRAGQLSAKDPQPPLVEGEDYYIENGNLVFTASFLLRRGYCCGSGCRHCPYPKEPKELCAA